jgi:competence ComEA-like helix-hairpin-helix protein
MKQVRFAAKVAIAIFFGGLIALAVVACGRLPRSGVAPSEVRKTEGSFHIKINTASAQELEQLPGVGKVIAERIVAYREQYGRFRRPEELLMVNGISDKKFREIREMIVVE